MHSAFIILPHISVNEMFHQSREFITILNYAFDKKYTDRDKCVGFVKGVKKIFRRLQLGEKELLSSLFYNMYLNHILFTGTSNVPKLD